MKVTLFKLHIKNYLNSFVFVGLASRIFPLTFEEDFLVLPLDVTDFSTHGECVAAVLKQFGKVK